MKLFYFILFSILISCKKESVKDATLPVITITNLVENQQFNIGDTITIQGNITDINTLEETSIHITSKFDNNEFLHLHYGLLNSNSWNFNVKHKVTHTNNTMYAIEVEAADEDGNTSSKIINVKVN